MLAYSELVVVIVLSVRVLVEENFDFADPIGLGLVCLLKRDFP